MLLYNTNKVKRAIQAYLDKNNSLPVLQSAEQDSELSVKELLDILISFHDLEKKSSNNRNYYEAEKAKCIYDLLIIKKTDFERCIELENEARLKQNYKEADLIKTHQSVIIKDVKHLLLTNRKSHVLQKPIHKSKLLVIDLCAILKSFKNLEKKAALERKYDKAEGSKCIHEILVCKKRDLYRYINLENKAKLKRKYKEAGLIKKFSDMVILDIKRILLIDVDLAICVLVFPKYINKHLLIYV